MSHVQRLLAAMMALALPQTGHAAAVVLWPVDPTIAADQRSTAIWIENRGDAPVTMQVRSLEWSQTRGDDDYAPQESVVSSPPIAEIAPGTRQLIRVIRRATTSETGEHAYRMLIDEIPAPPKADGAGATAALAVQMRYSIPLFTYGSADHGRADVSGRVVFENGHSVLEVRNRGSRHARLTDLRRTVGGQSAMVNAGLIGYVLAGAVRRFELPASDVAGARYAIRVDGVDQPLTGDI